jgi:hypothetical protein
MNKTRNAKEYLRMSLTAEYTVNLPTMPETVDDITLLVVEL